MRSNKAKYLTVYEELKQQITNEDYLIGDLLPAEPELQKRYNVSRITIRHAVDLLVDEGYVQRLHGVGTIIISQKKSLQLQKLLSFSEDNKGRNLHSSLFSFEATIPATLLAYSQLDLPKGAMVSCHERVRWIQDTPIGFHRIYCPSFISLSAEELEAPDASLYQLFQQKGYVVKKANETIESIAASEKLAKILKVEENSPLLYVQRSTKDQQDRLIEYAQIFYRGDQYRYSVELESP
ncbi:GntR family transcriptional regulator [Halobacillus amylolyticus]|uniref:GntR family transcriptional regulator n=1 Tax=Halobacillus amylolyticus TaxID=2932259 RepID=A0ABY4H9H3_9BACI|nr:GntR family transcriptional regulator [Halobacillus amylolyticus]UOR11327.1 GntR family transcriptional regulator [Halobacillus amylolyticus]